MNVQFKYPDYRPENIVRYFMLVSNKLSDVCQQAAHRINTYIKREYNLLNGMIEKQII